MNFAEADLFLHRGGKATGKRLDRKKIQNNTWLERNRFGQEEVIRLVLHNTAILTWLPDGTIILKANGWQTVTTKQRLNAYAGPVSVFTGVHKPRAYNCWWVGHASWRVAERRESEYGDWTYSAVPKARWVPFFDNIRIHQETGEVWGAEEAVHLLEGKDPGPTWSQRITSYLDTVTQPEALKHLGDVGETRKQPEARLSYRKMADSGYLDLFVLAEAINHDAAKKANLTLSPEAEALEWANVARAGKVPPRFRSTMRQYLAYHSPYEYVKG